MTTGLRELRQQASELVRRAEAGETVVVTVSGRPAAQLGPVQRPAWRAYSEIADIFSGPADTEWVADRGRLDEAVHDPFAQ